MNFVTCHNLIFFLYLYSNDFWQIFLKSSCWIGRTRLTLSVHIVTKCVPTIARPSSTTYYFAQKARYALNGSLLLEILGQRYRKYYGSGRASRLKFSSQISSYDVCQISVAQFSNSLGNLYFVIVFFLELSHQFSHPLRVGYVG